MSTYAAAPLGSVTSPTTSPAASSKQEDSDPNYTPNYGEPVNRVPRELASGFLERTKWQAVKKLALKGELLDIAVSLQMISFFLLIFAYDVSHIKQFWIAGFASIVIVVFLVRLFKSFSFLKKYKESFAGK